MMYHASSQPAGSHADAAFYRMGRLTAKLGVGRSTLYEWIKAGRFPSPVKLGPKAVGFRAEDVHAWIAAREAA
ncbi:helix-turn-helix transcriptional regulator [Paraburkholderia sp. GAS348]|uniref:helix-turn-helix transcriptional regulator n=1 Tax=Paraburkholderia sp. GAS348 TaxID=3035132 RepID=UPI003D20A068